MASSSFLRSENPIATSKQSFRKRSFQQFVALCCVYLRSLLDAEEPSNVFDFLQTTIVKERGPLGLYRGFTSLLIGTVPKTAVRFTAFGAIKQSLKVRFGMSGAGCGSCTATHRTG